MTPGRSWWTKRQVFGVLAVLPALVLSACSSEAGDTGGVATVRESVVTSNSVNSTRMVVSETEFSINVPDSQLTPGAYTFVVENSGSVSHDLVILGPGGESQQTSRIQSGGSSELTVNLVPGSYKLWCSIGNHRELGMSTEIAVS
ncbi:hypothetical protein AB0G00_31115 [Nocardia salmonicida]|uniref:hypothetical protein n=1 Tax=Nocardia TaxID=1817 RepID=UPI00117F4C4D|nr:hypothetical protein [Nocardia fluminea]